MFETHLAPFYLTQAGLLAPVSGVFFLVSHLDIMDTSWVILTITFVSPIFSIALLEKGVSKRGTQRQFV
jgi:hypothetical protein